MKSRKIVIVSHCVLNQNSVIEDWERARGAFPLAEILIREGAGIIQLPCPELIFKGAARPPLEYEDYNTEEYRGLCRGLLEPYILQIKDYLKNSYTLLGIIGIYNSPTCSISGKRGVLMEELFSLLEKEQIPAPFVDIPETYSEADRDTELENKIKKLLGR